jgi:Flp pilus assembly protein TadD
VRLAALDYESGEPARAEAALSRVLEADPTAEAWLLKAEFLDRANRPDEALRAARTGLDLAPRHPAARQIVGRLLQDRSRRP